ncbi:hypothetical protein XENORESO_014535 [Xenotaenia resolanae]|uniref:Uncharacterized protein n=1 Tax=Xenotaenia resolanae TaxID=208358 RepID=A0ABV0VQV5_9TELE
MRSTELFPHRGDETVPQSFFSLLRPSPHCVCHSWFFVFKQTPAGDEPGCDVSPSVEEEVKNYIPPWCGMQKIQRFIISAVTDTILGECAKSRGQGDMIKGDTVGR